MPVRLLLLGDLSANLFLAGSQKRELATTWAHDFLEMLPACSTIQVNSLKLLRERVCGVTSIRTKYLYSAVWSNAIFVHTNYIQIVKDCHLCTSASQPCAHARATIRWMHAARRRYRAATYLCAVPCGSARMDLCQARGRRGTDTHAHPAL